MPEFKNKEEYEKWKEQKAQLSQNSRAHEEKSESSQYQVTTDKSGFKVSKKIVISMLGLIILLISLVAIFNRGIDVAKFDPLVRAASKVKASTGVGLTFIQFGQYLQEYATEVMIIKGKVGNAKEKEILDYFSNALEIYNDSKTIWNAKNNDRLSTALAADGASTPNIEITDELIPIVQKYNLTVKEHAEGTSHAWKTISETSIQELWGTAGRLIDTATSSLQHTTK